MTARVTWGAWVLALMLASCSGRPPARPRPRPPAAAPRLPPDWMLTASLAGTVHADDRALPGARVGLELLVADRALSLGEVRTDPRGQFRFDRVAPGAGRLTVRAPGRASHQVTLWVDEGRNRAPTLDLGRSAPVAGRVRDDRDRPVPGALVRASSPEGWGTAARANAAGEFVLDGLIEGPYRLSVEAPEHVATVEPEIVAPASGVQLRLTRYYEIRGRVIGAARQASVRLAGSGVWPTRVTRTGADGSFLFSRVPGGIYELAAQTEAPPWAASEILAGLSVGPASPAPVELTLRPTGRVQGRVMQESGKPVAGAVLVLGQGLLSVLQNRVSSDAQGRFAFAPVAGADLRLSVWARGFLPILDQQIQALGSEPLRIVLKRGETLRGTVSDAAGNPVIGALVWVAYRGRSGAAPGAPPPTGQLGVTTGPVPPIPAAGTPLPSPPLAPGPGDIGPSPTSALTDGSGAFALLGLEGGELRVTADHPDYSRASTGWIQLTPGEQPEAVKIVLVAGAVLAGRILDERGRPLAGAQVLARGAGSEPRFTDSDLNGGYRLQGLIGRVSVAATRPGYTPAGRSIRMEAGQRYELDLVLELAQGQVRGLVLDPARLPLAGARVAARNEAGQQLGVTATDAGGGFELSGVGSRPLTLEVSRQGYLPVERRVRPGQEIEVQLGYPAVLAGRVMDRRTGAPVSRFTVTAEGEGVRRRADVAKGDGRFRLEGLAPGRLTLRVDAEGFAVTTLDLRLPSPDRAGAPRPEWVDVSIDPAATLEGQLTDGSGTPLVGATLVVGAVRAVSAAGGAFRLERVPEGSHAVEVRTSDGRRLRTDPVVVRGGESGAGLRLIAR